METLDPITIDFQSLPCFPPFPLSPFGYVLVYSHAVYSGGYSINSIVLHVKGCGMGPWLVLVSPCFRENVVATCKIGGGGVGVV